MVNSSRTEVIADSHAARVSLNHFYGSLEVACRTFVSTPSCITYVTDRPLCAGALQICF